MRLWRFLKILTHRFFADLCPMRAAALTFTTLLSLVPLMLFTFYILSFFPQFADSGHQIEQFLFNNFVASSANAISKELQIFIAQIKQFSVTTGIWLAFFLLFLIYNIIDTVNGVWHCKMETHFAISFFLYLLVIIVAPIIFAFLLLVSSYLTSLPLMSHLIEIDLLRKPLVAVSPFLIEWLVFTLFQWLMPSCRVCFRYAVIAGLITAVLFEITKWGFVIYFHYFSAYQLIYGALATIPIFFMWIYASWVVIILGTLICNFLQTHFREQNT